MIPGIPTQALPADQEVFSFDASNATPGAPRKSKFDFDDGDYGATAVSIVLGLNKAGTEYQYTVTFIGTEGPAKGIDYKTWLKTGIGADKQPIPGAKTEYTEKVFERVFGVKPEGKKFTFTSADIVGKPATLKLVGEEYNGKRSMKVRWVNAPKSDIASENANIPF